MPLPVFEPGTIAGAVLQLAINRMGKLYDIGDNIRVDGKIGPQTVTALNRIAGSIGLDGNLAASSALTVRSTAQASAAASTLATQLNYLADLARLPELPIMPIGPYKLGDRSAPPLPPAGTPGMPTSTLLSALKSPLGIAAIAIGGLLVVRSTKKGRRR